jgi:phosphatidylserine/phosphatidylglycerophosphate/cardiolipin synthase-like enzyme
MTTDFSGRPSNFFNNAVEYNSKLKGMNLEEV